MSRNVIRVAHLADLHFRPMTRHEEYREIFKAFCQDVQQQNVDYIFIAGDIWHTKTQGILPESIDFMTEILRMLSKVAPVHMMLGNHDMNCVNLTRQDAISPIVKAINDPRVVLYKQSGMYEFHPGIAWCVYSLYDEEKWPEVKPLEGKYNIACFHGSVRGALLDSDWEMSEGIKVDFFKEFDLTMLGDIHRHQFLSTREYNGIKKPWIGYPGSMAQQNFAESLVHGYLLWEIDIENRNHDVQFRNLPNPFPFVTIDWQGNVAKTLKEAYEFPNGSRFRIKSGTSIMQRDVAQLISELKHKHHAHEVAFKIEETVDRDTIQAGAITIAKDDLRNIEVVMELLREHYELETITEEEWDKIHVLVEAHLKAIHAEDTKNIKWTVKKLEWDNTFAYGEKNVINFEKLSGITGIFGPNRTGKSSIIGTLMYALFNGSDRGSLKNLYVINNRKDFCKTNAVVSVNGTDYLFERQTVKMENRNGPFGVTGLNAFKLNADGSRHELNGEQRNDTDKFIRSLIGTPEDFLITSVSTQDNLKRYINEGPTQRKQIVSRFLDLDIFERVYKLANKDVNTTQTLHKNIAVKNWVAEIATSRNEIKRLEDESKALGRELPRLRKEYAAKQMELESLSNVKPVSHEQLKSKKAEIVSLVNLLKQKQAEVESIKLSLDSKQLTLQKLISACEKIDIDDLRKRKERIDVIMHDVRTKNFSLHQEQSKLNSMEKSVKKLTTVPCGDQFPTCQFIRDSHENKATIDTQRTIVANFTSEIEALEAEILQLGGNPDAMIQKYERALMEQAKLQSEISTLTVNLVKIDASITSTQNSIKVAEDQYAELEKAFQDEQNQRRMQVKSDVDQLGAKIADSEQTRRKNSQFIGREETKIEAYVEEKKRFETLDSQLRVEELVASAFSKRGVPNRVIHNQLPVINAELNKLLHGIVNFSVELESDPETNSLDVFINYGDYRRVVELCSGMEKVVISLALRAALTIITTLPKSDIFVVDEGFADLDPTGIEICNRLLASFKEYFKNVIIITHIDGIKDIADNLIEITREDGCSRVVYE